ncbi:molecular chaperone [Oceanobacillus picturae]|uniref:Molecular chaperone n=1 Tax=Oceanobacillus picturae TaxID=171693 RepID=A0A0U9H959_9BACI|nr:molecular chaperone [Oceanobacillus picturae]
MSKKGYISASKFHSEFIRSDATDRLIANCYNAIKEKIRRERRNNDCTIRTGIDRRTS